MSSKFSALQCSCSMGELTMRIIFYLTLALICFSSFVFVGIEADELDLEQNAKLFDQMFGRDYEKVKLSSSKKDDTEYALELLESSSALKSKPGLQVYIKIQAAYLFQNSTPYKKKARDLFSEILPDLSVVEKSKIRKVLLPLQKQILSRTSKKKKNDYLAEIELFVSYSQLVANELARENKYIESIKVLRDAHRYLRMTDKEAANEFNKQIKGVQQDSKRFKQISSSIILLKTKPNDLKANLALAEYYLLEKSHLYKAWPYLEKSGDVELVSFFKNIKLCMDDQELVSSDGVSMNAFPLVDKHPVYFLKWLSSKDLDDPGNIILSQMKLVKTDKKISTKKIKLVMLNTVKIKGKKADILYGVYLRLVKNFDTLIAKVSEQKKLPKNTKRLIVDQLILNQYIALCKAKIKLAKDTNVDEVVKLKLDLHISKCAKTFEKRNLELFDVTLKTPFLLEQSKLDNGSVEFFGGNLYTFDVSSWKRFNKDFDIFVNNKPFDPKVKTDISVKDGQLYFHSREFVFLKSKKKKWSSNTEVSLEVLKEKSQTLDIAILLTPDKVGERNMFCVSYHVYQAAGWYGVMKVGESKNDFMRSALTKPVYDKSLWNSGKIKLTAVFKKKTLNIYINDKLHISNPITLLSKDKKFPNTTIQILIHRKYFKSNRAPVKIDNLYIGPPRKIRTKK